ncbi:MAG: hypothetical protein IJW71_04765 [Clostridia bacterium]|nr:hypothetical protein [Clostridia bacterium]
MKKFEYTPRRVTLFAGHYGSGKTNLAVNFALHLAEQGQAVTIADLDIVNPYFRTKDSAELLARAGIPLISPAYANTNVDLPALPREVYELVARRDRYAVLDVGGDDRGAYALGRYAPMILEENDYEMLFVANLHRPLTKTPADALEVMREIEAAGGIPFTGIVNNSNLGELSNADTLLRTEAAMAELAELSGLPICFSAAEAEIARELDGVFPLTLQSKYFDIKGEEKWQK